MYMSSRPQPGRNMSSPGRPSNSMPMSRTVPEVPVAVTALLDATRRLENALRSWAAFQVSETEVSDVFVDVGNKFHEMLAAFASHNIDMTDVSGFLQELRGLLEECLSEDPTPQNVNYLMPQVRAIIASLLVGLKNKQDIYRRARRSGY